MLEILRGNSAQPTTQQRCFQDALHSWHFDGIGAKAEASLANPICHYDATNLGILSPAALTESGFIVNPFPTKPLGRRPIRGSA
jgi:hypothetical protein